MPSVYHRSLRIVDKDVLYAPETARKPSKYRPVRAPNGVGGGAVSKICEAATTPAKHRGCHAITCSCACHNAEIEAEL